jgi:hypothetical protein
VERRAAARPEPPADDGVAWYMALDGNRTGPFSRKQLLDKVAPLPRDADLHVWNEKLGSWKPPTDVPALAHELAARRQPAAHIPAPPSLSPPPPPPFPGAPRRPTGPVAPLAAAAPAPARQTGAHPIVGSPIAPGAGLKLPPPVAPPGGRRPTGPVARPAGLAASAHAHAHAPEPGLDLDPSSMLETPAPQPHMLHGLGTNGVSHAEPNGAAHGAAAHGATGAVDRSDVLNTLNLPSKSGAGAAPRLLSSEAVVGWEPTSGDKPAARQKATRAILALGAVVALICIAFFFVSTKKPKAVVAPPPKAVADPLAGIVDNPPPNTPPPPAAAPPAPAPAPEPAVSLHGRGKGHPVVRGRGAAGPAPTQPPAAGTLPPPPVADDSANARYRDSGKALNITGGSGVSRPAPQQADIMKVIANNRGGIKNCYQRALLRDNSLTHGKISVKVTIGISGRVKHTAIDGPQQFRSLEPCIKEMVGRWVFPPSGDEYGTEFVYVFQGNE